MLESHNKKKSNNHKKISNNSEFLRTASAESRTVMIFFYKYIISQCIWRKKIKNLAPVV